MVQVENKTKLFIRFRFYKRGSLQYISHLDLVRTMNKIVVRAGLPLWYTEGFNPKPKMIFAAPLSIGTESDCELLDVRLSEPIDPSEAMERMNRNMTDEMQVTEAYYPEKPFTDLAWIAYAITLRTRFSCPELAEAITEFLNGESITVLKKTKSGERDVDIRPGIRLCNAVYLGDEIKLAAVLSGNQSSFLNPELLIRAIRERFAIILGDDPLNERYSIERLETYSEDLFPFR